MQRRIKIKARKDGQFEFQAIGKNGEPQDRSEPYDSFSNSKRGAHDLFPEDELIFELGTDSEKS